MVRANTAHTATYGIPLLLHLAKIVGACPVMASAYRLRDAANMKLVVVIIVSGLPLAIGTWDIPVSARPRRGENHRVDDTRESI